MWDATRSDWQYVETPCTWSDPPYRAGAGQQVPPQSDHITRPVE